MQATLYIYIFRFQIVAMDYVIEPDPSSFFQSFLRFGHSAKLGFSAITDI